jgi:hypothetical protein
LSMSQPAGMRCSGGGLELWELDIMPRQQRIKGIASKKVTIRATGGEEGARLGGDGSPRTGGGAETARRGDGSPSVAEGGGKGAVAGWHAGVLPSLSCCCPSPHHSRKDLSTAGLAFGYNLVSHSGSSGKVTSDDGTGAGFSSDGSPTAIEGGEEGTRTRPPHLHLPVLPAASSGAMMAWPQAGHEKRIMAKFTSRSHNQRNRREET